MKTIMAATDVLQLSVSLLIGFEKGRSATVASVT